MKTEVLQLIEGFRFCIEHEKMTDDLLEEIFSLGRNITLEAGEEGKRLSLTLSLVKD